MTTMTPPGRRTDLRGALFLIAASALLLAVSIDVGVSAGQHGFARPTLLRFAVVLGALLVAVTARRFEYFLLIVLVLRPALDVAKDTGGPPLLASVVAGMMVLGVALWLGAQAYAGTLRPPSVLGWLAVLLLAAMLVSSMLSDPVRGTLQTARLAAAVAVFLALEQLLQDPTRRRRVLVACYLSAMIPLAMGAYQQGTGNFRKQSSSLGRVTGTFVHPNAFGFYLVLLLVMGAAVFRHLQGWPKLLVGLVLGAAAVELLLTYSRGSWVALIAGVLVVGVLQARKLLVLTPVGLALVPLLAPSVLVRLSDLSQAETINGTPGNSFFWRVDHWAVVLRGAKGHELFGLGPGAADFLGDTVLPPHNDFLRMYVETGVLGFTLYLALLAAAVLVAVRALRSQHVGGLERGLAVGAVACTVAFLVGSIGGNLISQVAVLLYLFTFLAAASAAGREEPVPAEARTPAEVASTTPPRFFAALSPLSPLSSRGRGQR